LARKLANLGYFSGFPRIRTLLDRVCGDETTKKLDPGSPESRQNMDFFCFCCFLSFSLPEKDIEA
jgi:hypothetical protein